MSQVGAPDLPDPTRRFSSRVENYLRHRPRYPAGMLELIGSRCRLTRESVIADIGSGTGKLTEVFLAAGHRVIGIEPNREMREAGERLLAGYSLFTSMAACAECTSLPSAGVDLIVAGQAFHWFDRALCRKEFARILKPGGWVAVLTTARMPRLF
jgi:SAM-dependent methyltransferase